MARNIKQYWADGENLHNNKGTEDLPLPTYNLYSHQHQMALINQPKTLVASAGYNMAISINITVKRMSAPLKGNVGK
jgi:hypothetical protein